MRSVLGNSNGIDRLAGQSAIAESQPQLSATWSYSNRECRRICLSEYETS